MDELRGGGGRRKQPKTSQCMPRLRRSSGAAPGSLLERFREAVFKLIMISAFTKRSRSTTSSRPAATASSTRRSPAGGRHHDSYRSEAVEDCIEFFKRSAEGAKGYGVSEDAMEIAGYNTLFPVM